MSTATQSKSINVFLIDGVPSGRVKCTLANWTGVAYKLPRTELEKCKDRNDLSQSGVYFLFGISDQKDENVVYVGQASNRKNGEGILNRLIEHKRNPEKDYWTEAVVFTTSNNSFGPTEISYLENRFTNMAKDAKRYHVNNSNDPSPGNITEEKKSELDEFITYAKIVMGTLGHKVLEPLISEQKTIEPDISTTNNTNTLTNNEEGSILYLKRTGVEAQCKQTNEGFVVLKGSQLSINVSESAPDRTKQLRVNAQIDEHSILQQDTLFNSPSAAASFVLGTSANGLTEWKTKNGTTLKALNSGNP